MRFPLQNVFPFAGECDRGSPTAAGAAGACVGGSFRDRRSPLLLVAGAATDGGADDDGGACRAGGAGVEPFVQLSIHTAATHLHAQNRCRGNSYRVLES